MKYKLTVNVIGGSVLLETENGAEAKAFAITRDCRLYRNGENVAIIIPNGEEVAYRRDKVMFPTFNSLFED